MANLKTHHDRTGMDHLDPSTHPARDAASLRRILAARDGLAAAEEELRDAVRAAREAGDSWTVIRGRARHHAASGAAEVRRPLTTGVRTPVERLIAAGNSQLHWRFDASPPPWPARADRAWCM